MHYTGQTINTVNLRRLRRLCFLWPWNVHIQILPAASNTWFDKIFRVMTTDLRIWSNFWLDIISRDRQYLSVEACLACSWRKRWRWFIGLRGWRIRPTMWQWLRMRSSITTWLWAQTRSGSLWLSWPAFVRHMASIPGVFYVRSLPAHTTRQWRGWLQNNTFIYTTAIYHVNFDHFFMQH